MDLQELLLVFTTLWSLSSALRCYKCEPNKNNYQHVAICEHFDYSDKYITDCSLSTMCYKKEIMSTLGNGIKLYERGCAHQIMSDYQEKVNHRWVHVDKIHEPYKEGCEESAQEGKVTTTVNCYCRGDLCNSATKTCYNVLMFTGLLFLKFMLQ